MCLAGCDHHHPGGALMPLVLGSATSANQRSPELHRRLRYVVTVVVLALGVLVGRLWQLQVLRGDQYYQAARDNLIKQRAVPAVRGKILDRKGRPLADNRPAFNLYVEPDQFDAARRARLIELLDLSAEEVARLDERLATARARGGRSAALVLEDQGRDRAALVAQARAELPGVVVHDEPYRRYPEGVVGGHLVGYLSHPNAKELAACEADGCGPGDFIGRYGVERQWENYLRGKRGTERYITNARGDRIDDAAAAELIEGPRLVPPVTGQDVVLTLDLDLQHAAEKAVARHAAAGVVLVEVATGRILAMVSTPSFDPNVMTGHLTRAEDERMRADPRKPYIDKTLQQDYPPGSVFKFVTAGAALEGHQAVPSEQIFCPGYYQRGKSRFGCTASHGKLDLLGAIQHSCNIYFWTLSERIGLDRMAQVAVDFGFDAPSGLGLNGDIAGRIPTKAWYEKRGVFKVGYTLNAATGQGDVEVTVTQVAMAYATLANGGRLFVPQVVREIRTPAGELVASFPPEVRRRVALSPATFDILREGMVKVTNELGGTGYEAAKGSVIDFAGKTGTAQVASRIVKDDGSAPGWNPRRDHAWFGGWAPARQPEVAIAVFVEHGGPGGKVAGPVAREVLEAWARQAGRATEPRVPLGTPLRGGAPKPAPAEGSTPR
jgi:penicillin-binding protein 2